MCAIRSFFVISLCFSGLALADQAAKVHIGTCPAINMLKKNTKTHKWYTKDGWRSYTPSFANHIKKFLGAQWQGTNLGDVFCLYKGEADTFPVKLHYHGLAFEPATQKAQAWTKNLGGYKNCISNKQSKCQFKPILKKKEHDIYQQVEDIQHKGNTENAF